MKNNQMKLSVVFGCAAALTSATVLAVEPNPIEIGNLQIIPTLGISASDDDNIFRSELNEVDSTVINYRPRIQAILDTGPNQFVLDTQLDKGEYDETSEDDYDDWSVAGSAHFELNESNMLDFNASYAELHEPRGTGYSQGSNIPIEPDEYEETRVGASYQLGNNTSLGRIVLNAGNYEREYTNNRVLTAFRDREDDNWGATFYWNISPRTSVLVEYRNRDVEYQNTLVGTDSLDSEEDYVFVGIEWEATAATTGSIRVGQGDKEFSDVGRDDVDKTSYEAFLTWSPVEYSTFNFFASRLFDETTGLGDAIERETFGANWRHEWTPRISTSVNASFNDEEYVAGLRDDDFDIISAGITYSVARWLDIGIDFGNEERDSSRQGFSYDRDFVAFRIEASL